METDDLNTVHATAELATGNRADLFQSDVISQLINITCGGCGLHVTSYPEWEEHVRDMLEIEDEDHCFTPKVSYCEATPHEGTGYLCDVCGKNFSTQDSRDCHRQSVSTCVRLVCPQCAALAPDMEFHIKQHKKDQKCGECGCKFASIDNHMTGVHNGFMSVLILQSSRCGGDQLSLISLELVIATNARFLSSEVKPMSGREGREGLPDSGNSGQHKGDDSSHNILVKSSASTSTKEKSLIRVKKPHEIDKSLASSSKAAEALEPWNKHKKTEFALKVEYSEREKALMPPAYLPVSFFDEDGNRIWEKLPSGIHQCELCGFMAKTKNKYREKQDHLMKWHFSQRIEEIMPITGKKPFACPECPFTGKDRQCVVRHYTGKHCALDIWMTKFLESVSNKTLTREILQMVENVDVNPRVGELQIPAIKKIVNYQDFDFHPELNDLPLEYQPHAEKENSPGVKLTRSPLPPARTRSPLPPARTRSPLPPAREVKTGQQDCESGEAALNKTTATRKSQRKPVPNLRPLFGDESPPVSKKTKKEAKKDLSTPRRLSGEDGKQEKQGEEKVVQLQEVGGEGLKCLRCWEPGGPRCWQPGGPSLKSLTDLKQHIHKNHMELCVEGCFVKIKNLPAEATDKSFYYYFCCRCGKSFSQTSGLDILRQHRMSSPDHPAVLDTTHMEQQINVDDSGEEEEDEDEVNEARIIADFLGESEETPGTDQARPTSKRPHQGRFSVSCPCKNCSDPDYDPEPGTRVHQCFLQHNCGRLFTKLTHLKAHLRSYNNERPFICDHKGCGKRFVRRDELKRHAWIHSGETRFRCECGKGYGRADHYRSHALKCHLAATEFDESAFPDS